MDEYLSGLGPRTGALDVFVSGFYFAGAKLYVTTLLSYRLLERIASAKLQAIAFSSSRPTPNFRLSRCSDPEPYPRKRRCGIEDNVATLFINT
jgi:hypothetical protein